MRCGSVQLSSQSFFNARKLRLELPQLVQAHVDALLLHGAIGLCNLENKDGSCLVNVLAVRRGDFVAEHDLEVGQLLQPHQTRHRVQRVRLTSLRIDRASQSLHDCSLLNGASGSDLLDKLCLGLLGVRRVEGGQVGNDEGLEGIGNPSDFLVRPADALVLKLMRDGLCTQLPLGLRAIGNLGCDLRHQVLNHGL